ncbi:MAG: histidine kinase [Cytophagales bacterium]
MIEKVFKNIFSVGILPSFSYQEALRYRFSNAQIYLTLFFNIAEILSNPQLEVHIIAGFSAFVSSLSFYLNSTQKQKLSGYLMTFMVWLGLVGRILFVEEGELVLFFLPVTFFLATLLNSNWVIAIIIITVLNSILLYFIPIEIQKIANRLIDNPETVLFYLIHSFVYCLLYFIGTLFLLEKDSLSKLLKNKDSQAKNYFDLQTFSLIRAILPIGTWIYDFNSGKIIWDKNTFASFGLEYGKDKEPSYEDYKKLIHPDDFILHTEAVNKLISGEIPHFINNIRHLQTDGSYKWMKAYGRVLMDESGKPAQLLGIVHENDEEQKLKENSHKTVKVFEDQSEKINIGVIEIRNGIVTKCNRLFLEWMGLEPSKIYKKKFDNFLESEVTAENKIFLRNYDGEIIEFKFFQFDDFQKKETVRTLFLFNESQRINLNRNLENQKKFNAELSKDLLNEEDTFKSISKCIEYGMLIVDLNGSISFVNHVMREIFYILEFKHFSEFASLFKKQEDFECFFRAVKSPEDSPMLVTELCNHVGEYIEFSIKTVQLNNGKKLILFRNDNETKLLKKEISSSKTHLQEINHENTSLRIKIEELEEELRGFAKTIYDSSVLLRENQENIHLLSEASSESILFFDGDKIHHFNAKACEMFEYSQEEFSTLKIYDLLSPSERKPLSEILNQVEKISISLSLVFLKKSGKPFFGKVNIQKTEFKGNNAFVININDQTELMLQKRELEKSERNLLRILEEMPIALMITKGSKVIYLNHVSKSLFGNEQENFFNSFLNTVDCQESSFKKLVEIKVDESIKTLMVSCSNIIFENQKATLWVMSDMTEKNEFQKSIDRFKAFQDSILNVDDIGIWAVDKSNKLYFFNSFHAKMTKLATGIDLFHGMDYRTFVFEEYLETFAFLIDSAFSGKSEKILLKIKNNDQHHVWAESVSKPIMIDNQIEFVLILSRNVTELVETQINLENKEKLISISQDIAKIGSWIYDVENQKIEFSDKVFDLLKAQQFEILDIEWLKSFVGEKTFELAKKLLIKKMLKREPVTFDVMTRRFETKTQWLRISAIPVVENDKMVSVNGSIQDVSDFKLSELRVLENNQILDTIMAKLPVAFQLFDLNGFSLRHNEVQDVLVTNSFNQVNTGLFNILEELKKQQSEYFNNINKAFETGEEVFIQRMKFGSSQNPLFFDTLFSPIFNDNFEKVAIVMLGIDVSEVVKNEETINKKHIELESSNREASEYKLMALRAAMNPHFLFNVLNSIQFLINKNDKLEALANISLFSKLMRKVLASSGQTKVSLASDLELMDYYIKLENLRFENKFKYYLELRLEQNPEDIFIPPLILQPIVENAIIHGLMNKVSEDKILSLVILQERQTLKCIIEDNGIGRKNDTKPKNGKSFGLELTLERLKLVNINQKSHLSIEDLKDELGNAIGTKVTLSIEL